MTFIGQIVSTPYGAGKIVEIREIHAVIEPLTWKMDRNQKPTFNINHKDVSPMYSEGDLVTTVFGDGFIMSVREEDAIYVVLLDAWKLAQGQSPTLFLHGEALSRRVNKHLEGLSIATKVRTPYGNGIITSIRPSDSMVLVRPDNWIMADGKPPQFYMNPSQVTSLASIHSSTVDSKIDDVASVAGKIKRCIELKNNGTAFFKLHDFENAKVMYTNALTVLQYIGDNLTNDEKASVMEQSVPCHNNMALCSLKLHKWADCEIYARNAVMLISALEAQIPLGSKVWECLQKRNLTLDTLLKKWKKRSYYLAGKGYTGSLDLKNAKDNFKAALDLIDGDPVYVKEANELRKLIVDTTKKIVKENKIEKKMWSKAFSGEGKDEQKVASPSSKEVKNVGQGGAGGAGQSKEDDPIDLREFGLPNLTPAATKKQWGSSKSGAAPTSPSSSTVAKKSSSTSLYFGGAALFATLGVIFGFTYFRFNRR